MQKAYNPSTGEVLFLVGDQWTKPEQTAENPKTGERAYLVNNQWEIFKPPAPATKPAAPTPKAPAPTQPAEDFSTTDPMGGDLGSAIMGAAAPRNKKIYTGSVFDTQPLPPAEFDPREAERLSRRAYAEETTRPPRRQFEMKATPEAQTRERTGTEIYKDTVLGAFQGGVGFLKGITDNINAGDNPGSEGLEAASLFLERLKTPQLRGQAAMRQAQIANARENQGEIAATRVAFNTMFSRAGADIVAQGAGSIIPSLGMSMLGLGVKSMAAANALASSGSAANQAAEQLKRIKPEEWSNNEIYQTLREKGMSHKDAVAMLVPFYVVPAQATGFGTGYLSGRTGLEKSLAGRAEGTALKRGLAELAGEEAETLAPQFVGNLTARSIDERTSPFAGLGQAAVETAAGALPGSLISAAAKGAPTPSALPAALGQNIAPPAPAEAPAPPTPPADLGPLGEERPGAPTEQQKLYRSFDEMEQEETEKITQSLLNQNFPEDSARRIAAKRVLENRKQRIKDAIVEPAQDEIEQRVKELIDAGIDPKVALTLAPQQIRDEKEADAFAQEEVQGAPDVTRPIPTATGTGDEVSSAAAQGTASTGVGGPERYGMVSAESDVGGPAAREGQQPSPLSFTTAKGSEYTVDANGKTSRTKKSAGAGQGTTYAPHTALYVAPGDHNEILSDMQGGMGNNSVRLGYVENDTFVPIADVVEIPQGAQPIVGVFNKETNAVVGAYPAQTAPVVGLHPVEKLYTPDGKSNTHIGNAITSIKTQEGKGQQPSQFKLTRGAVTPETVSKLSDEQLNVELNNIYLNDPENALVQAELTKRQQGTPSGTTTPEAVQAETQGQEAASTADDQAALQAELDEIQNASPEDQAFIDQQATAAKKRAPGAGRKPLTAEQKAAKEGERKETRKDYTAAERQFSGNKNSLLKQLEAANTPVDEAEMENEVALEQAKREKDQEKLFVVKELLALEAAHRGTALGKRVKTTLNDRTKISEKDIERAKRSKTRQETILDEARQELNAANQAEAGTYTTKARFSEARKNGVRKANPKLTGIMTGAQALTVIAKSGSWFQKLLANRLRQFVPNLRIVVLEKGQPLPARLTRAGENPEGRWNGLFMPGTDPVIYITGASFGDFNGQNNVTVLHEILHAALNSRLYAGMADLNPKAKKFTDQIITLMELARDAYGRMEGTGLISDALTARVTSTALRDEDTGEIYYEIFTSPDEFLSYALTETSVQNFLRRLKGVETPIGKVASAFSDFVRAASRVLGIGTGKNGEAENNALMELIDATDKLLSAPMPEGLIEAIDETMDGVTYASATNKPKEPVSTASVIPDELKEQVRTAEELKKAAAIARETVAASREGEEGKGIEMMQMARDPEKALVLLKGLVNRKWQNMTHTAVKRLVAMPTMPFLADWSGIKSLEDVSTQLQNMLGMSNSLQAGAGSILASFKKELNPLWGSAKKFREDFASLVYESTIAQIDPSNSKAKERSADIDALWNKVGAKGQNMYRQLKQYYEDLIDLYSDLLDQQVMAIQGMAPEAKENLIKVLRQTFEAGARITPYFPLVRRGNYWLRVSEKVGKETKEAFYMFESVGERNQRAAEIAASRRDDVDNMMDNGTFDMGDTIAGLRAATQGNSEMLTKVFDAIDQEKFDSPQAKEALKDAIYQIYLNTMPEQKFRGQFIHRKDRAGFSTDVLRNISTTASSTSMHLAKLKYSPLLRNSLSAAREAAKGNSNLTPFVDEAQERINLALEGDKNSLGDAIAGFANKVSFFWFLSGASSALIQPSSLYVSALPVLGANHNNIFAAGRELAKMVTYINQYSVIRENPDGTTSLVAPSIINNKDVTEDEKRAIREMFQRGVTQSTYASEVYGYKSIPTAQASTVLGKTKELGVEAADLLVGSLMHNIERLTREAVYLASYRLGIKRHLSPDAAINQAVSDVNEALGNYDVTARPRFMQRGIGKVLSQFKTFPLHMTLLLCTNFVKMLPFLNKEGKKAAAVKFFGIYLTAGSIAGLAGIPAFGPIIGVVNYLFKELQGEDDWPDELKALDPTTWFRNVFLQEKLGDIMIGNVSVADLLDSGLLNAVTGSAIGERVGLNDMWGRDTKEAQSSREGMVAYILDKMGPTVSLGLSAADAFDAFSVGDYVKAWDKLSPAAIRNIRFAMRMADEGIKDSKGNVIVPPDEISTGRLFAQIIGFRPAEMARIADAGFKLTAAEQRIVNERNRLILSAKVAIRKQNDEGFEAFETIVGEKMGEFNEKHPTYAIYGDDLVEQLVKDMETRAGARLGVPVTEKNAVFTDRVLSYLEARIERERADRKK